MPYDILNKYTVLDLSNRLSGSFCAKLLSQYGCRVIKVEPPEGDPERTHNTPMFLHLNTGKESLTLDLKKPNGKEILKKLVNSADILIETFKPDYMKSIGLSYDDLCEINPSLIMTSITPFGQSGPNKDFDYTELTIFSMSGGMHREGLPENHPIRYAAEASQHYAGNTAAAAITSALFKKITRNQGDWIDISIQECFAGHPHQIALRAPFIYSGMSDERMIPRFMLNNGSEPYAVGTFKCKNGFISFLPLGARMWPLVAKLMEREDLVNNTKFNTPEKRFENRHELESILQKWLNTKTKEEIFEITQHVGLPGAPALEIKEVFENEQFKHREFFTTLETDDYGKLKYAGDPFRFVGKEYQKLTNSPKLGEQTEEILSNELSISKSDIEKLKNSSTI
tara:strand:- start:165 stop:1355 length:1191 start_codon:yes stop_codon:yes gene_type:complete